MLVRPAKLFVVLALTMSLGLHWMVLQSVAWMGMMVSYSHTDSLPEAFVKTFDGRHPCQICKVVQDGKKAEKKQDTVKSSKKLDFLMATVEWPLPSPSSRERIPDPTILSLVYNEQPPVPPPRRT